MSLIVTGSSEKTGVPLNTVIRHMKSATAHKNFDDCAIDRAVTPWRARFNGVTSFRLVVTCREIPSQWAKTVAFY
jgi:hypothetical protein